MELKKCASYLEQTFLCLTFSVISNITLTHIFNLGKLACVHAIKNTKSFKTTEHLEY